MAPARKRENFARCTSIIGFLFLLGLAFLPKVQTQQQINDTMQQLSKRNTNFAFKLYQLMAEQQDVILSPLMISIALTMTSFGAGNDTLQQLYEALDLQGFSDRREIAKGYAAIIRSLDVNGNTSFVVFNRLSTSENFNVKKAFKNIIVNDFGTDYVPFNIIFEDNPVSNNQSNKQLCTEQTTYFNFSTLLSFGNDVASNESASDEPALGLISSIFFKGKWAQQFCKEKTYPEEFRLENLSNCSHPTMHARGGFFYGEDEDLLDAKILKMDFTGFRVVMYVILPNKLEGFAALKKDLNAERFENLKKKMRLQDVAVSLPTYMGTRMQNLSPDLKNLSIFDLENETKADLKEMADLSGGNLLLKRIFYTSHIEFGEPNSTQHDDHAPSLANSGFVHDGQVASHFVSHVGKRDNREEHPKQFYANHPFVFIIYDTLTDLILFIGNLDNFAKVSSRI